MDTYNRLFNLGEDFTIEGEILERALESFEGAALKFAYDAISDAKQRDSYSHSVARVKMEMLAEVKAGRVSVKEAAEHCYEMRNKIMAMTRLHTSKQGVAVAEAKKLIARPQAEMLDVNANRLFGKSYLDLNDLQKQAVYYELIESSARPNAAVTAANKVLRVTGKVLIVVTAVYATYEVVNAENKSKEAVRQGAVIGGGFAATALAGLAVSTVCGPAAPVCTIGVLLAAGGAGGWAASELVSTFDDELEEFSRWQLR